MSRLLEVLGFRKYAQYERIALAGKMRSGKDSVGDHLVNNYGFKRFAFGDGVKAVTHQTFGEFQGKPRAHYQGVGQAMRQINPDVWINYLARQLDGYKGRVVITDMRQPNELEYLKARGFLIVRVSAPDELRIARAIAAGDKFKQSDLTHETEMHVDRFLVHYNLENVGSLDELRRKVDEMVAKK